MMGSVATIMVGSISSTTRDEVLGSCRSSSSHHGRVRVSRGRLGWREATDLTVAQAVVDERENLARDRDAGLVAPATLRDPLILAGEDLAAVVAADPLDERPPQQPRALLGDPTAAGLEIRLVMTRGEPRPRREMRRGREPGHV